MGERRKRWQERITLDHWMAGVPTSSAWFWPRLVAYRILAYSALSLPLIAFRNALDGTLCVFAWRNWGMAFALPPILLLATAPCALCAGALRRVKRWLRHQR